MLKRRGLPQGRCSVGASSEADSLWMHLLLKVMKWGIGLPQSHGSGAQGGNSAQMGSCFVGPSLYWPLRHRT